MGRRWIMLLLRFYAFAYLGYPPRFALRVFLDLDIFSDSMGLTGLTLVEVARYTYEMDDGRDYQCSSSQ
jgi:hypothetical protein